MAKYNKKRARELRQDAFRKTTFSLIEWLGNRLEGKGQQILRWGGIGLGVLLILGVWSYWSSKKTNEARRALGKAIEIAQAQVTASPAPGSNAVTFPSEKERAQHAVDEFQKVADKYGNPYHEIALFFVASNHLITDRPKGISELQSLAKSSDTKIVVLSKFALAGQNEIDTQYDSAVTLYTDLVKMNSEFIDADTANLRLAGVYEKQGKKKEAVDLLFSIVEKGRKAKGPDGRPAPQSSSVREAETQLEKLDAARFAQLPVEAPSADLPF